MSSTKTALPGVVSAPIQPGDHATAEAVALLGQFGIYTGITFYPAFPVESIKTNRIHQIRKQAIDVPHAEEMKAAMAADPNAEWPAMLLWDDDGRFAVLNGQHRTWACRQIGRDTFPCVVVDLSGFDNPAAMANQIAMKANMYNGLPVSQEDRLMNGMHLMDNGLSVREAADVCGVTRTMLDRFKHAQDAKMHMGRLAIPESVYASYTNDALVALAKIRNKAPIVAAAACAREAQMTTASEQAAFFNEVAALGDADLQTEFIAQVREKFKAAIAATQNGRTLPKVKVHPAVKALRSVVKSLDPATVTGAFQTVSEIDAALEEMREVQSRTSQSIKVLTKAKSKIASA